MSKKAKAAGVKWDRMDFLKAYYVNRGDVHGSDWDSFYDAMNDACLAVTGSALDENALSMRVGAAKSYAAKAGLEQWDTPVRPRKAPPKPPSIADLMAQIANGDIELDVVAK